MNVPADSALRTEARLLETPAPAGEPYGRTTDHHLPLTEPKAPELPPPLAQIEGYRILGEIARGGMGVVVSAHDLTLDREVAVKVLLDGMNSDTAAVRFVRESKIAAKLAHPGIPPIHALGVLPDGSPFLVMKLIRGKTLADLLRDRNVAPVDNQPADPTAWQPAPRDLSRFLQVFEQVAQAVGFAHARGIIHRDLKPANVMVGEFGEVQVMDWGLAKILSDREQVSDGFDSDPEARAGKTQAGAVMGTPAYMAPEQARGEVVDGRADVFALGAMLCVILTDTTPFAGGQSAHDTIRQAAAGDIGAALGRLDACGADAELIALAKRCLAPQADDRPVNAQEVAAAVASYRADVERRLRQTEAQRAAAEAKADEQQKRRRVMMAATGLVCLVLAAGAGVSTWQAIRAGNAEKETRTQLEETDKARSEAELARDQAKQRYLLALAAFDDMVFAIQNKLAKRPGTLELRRELLSSARGGLKKLLAEAERHGNPDQKLVWSYFQMGNIEQLLGNFAAARQEYQTGHDLAKRLADADPANSEAQRDLSASLAHLGDEAMRLKVAHKALGYFQEKFEIDRRLADADPTNADRQRDLSLSHGRLGDVSLLLGRTKEAHQFYKRKLEITQTLAGAYPTNAVFQRDLAVSHELLGNSAAYLQQPKIALDCYRKNNAIMQRLLDADPQNTELQRDVCVSLGKLGDLHQDLWQAEAALGYYEKAIVLLQKLSAADPRNIKAQLDLFIGYVNLGSTEASRYEYGPAVAWFRKGRAVIVPLHEKKLLVGQFEHAVRSVDQQIEACLRFARAIAELDFALKQPASQVKELLDVRLHMLVKNKDRPEIVATAEAYSQLAEKNAKLCYGAAGAWSLASSLAKDNARLRDEYASRAMALLRKTPTGKGQFAATRAALAAHIKQDTDMAGLHEREDFRAFVKALETEGPVKE